MAFVQWDGSFASYPTDESPGSVTDNAFVDLKAGIRSVFQGEHYFEWLADTVNFGGSDTNALAIARQGKSKPGSGRAFFYAGTDINNVGGNPYGLSGFTRYTGTGRTCLWYKTNDHVMRLMVSVWTKFKDEVSWGLKWIELPQGNLGDLKFSNNFVQDLSDPLNPLLNKNPGWLIANGEEQSVTINMDGQTYTITVTPPDLTDRFIRSTVVTGDIGDTGGYSDQAEVGETGVDAEGNPVPPFLLRTALPDFVLGLKGLYSNDSEGPIYGSAEGPDVLNTWEGNARLLFTTSRETVDFEFSRQPLTGQPGKPVTGNTDGGEYRNSTATHYHEMLEVSLSGTTQDDARGYTVEDPDIVKDQTRLPAMYPLWYKAVILVRMY